MMMMMMQASTTPVAYVCTALLGLLLFTLGAKTSLTRQRAARGTATVEQVRAMSRAHGNTAEYAPFLAILFLLVHYMSNGRPGFVLNVVMVTATVSRLASAYGIANPLPGNARNVPRYFGALGTYACGFVLSLTLLFMSPPKRFAAMRTPPQAIFGS